MGDDHDLVQSSGITLHYASLPQTHPFIKCCCCIQNPGFTVGKDGYSCVCIYTCACMCASVCVCVGMLRQPSCPALCNLLLCLWDFSGKTTGVGSHSLYTSYAGGLWLSKDHPHLISTYSSPSPLHPHAPHRGTERFMKLFL